MTKIIGKTTYIEYLKCPKNSWLKLYKPELPEFILPEPEQALLHQGNFVERLAQQLFPTGISIEEFHQDLTIALTKKHINLKTPVLFQPMFIWGNFLVRNDVLEYDIQADLWNLYEVKAKTSFEKIAEEFDCIIEDITFQYIVLKEQGLKIGKISIIHLNKDYVKNDAINIAVNEIFIIKDVTDKVIDCEQATRLSMQEARIILSKNEQELFCKCIYKGRSKHCPTFKYSHKISEYSVHDIARIGSNPLKLAKLVDGYACNINDIPENFELTQMQKNQVDVYKSQNVLVDYVLLKQELDALKYPLYFLDYETYASAIPLFNGFKPYQHIVFQFSLHVIADKNSEPDHFEYLHESKSDASLCVIQKLLKFIGPQGNIVVWNKSFEQGKNIELVQRHPDYKEFLDDINNRMYDLEGIFKKQMYVHHAFTGKTSIKNILPVLAPELSYKDLNIQEGATASQRWFSMVNDHLTIEKQQAIATDLKKYCKLDTYAMYKIYRFLRNEIMRKN